MKAILIILSLLFSFEALALDWYDLELDQTVVLDRTLVFEKEKIYLNQGENFKLYDIISLPINVEIYQFEVLNCPGVDVTTDMIIVDPTVENNDPSVGVQLEESCTLNIYVETKDLFSKSLFVTK